MENLFTEVIDDQLLFGLFPELKYGEFDLPAVSSPIPKMPSPKKIFLTKTRIDELERRVEYLEKLLITKKKSSYISKKKKVKSDSEYNPSQSQPKRQRADGKREVKKVSFFDM